VSTTDPTNARRKQRRLDDQDILLRGRGSTEGRAANSSNCLKIRARITPDCLKSNRRSLSLPARRPVVRMEAALARAEVRPASVDHRLIPGGRVARCAKARPSIVFKSFAVLRRSVGVRVLDSGRRPADCPVDIGTCCRGRTSAETPHIGGARETDVAHGRCAGTATTVPRGPFEVV